MLLLGLLGAALDIAGLALNNKSIADQDSEEIAQNQAQLNSEYANLVSTKISEDNNADLSLQSLKGSGQYFTYSPQTYNALNAQFQADKNNLDAVDAELGKQVDTTNPDHTVTGSQTRGDYTNMTSGAFKSNPNPTGNFTDHNDI